jgi:hypothetical protein
VRASFVVLLLNEFASELFICLSVGAISLKQLENQVVGVIEDFHKY